MDDPFDLPPDVLRRIPLFAELSKVLSWSGGPVNWELARQVAVSIAAGEQPSTPVTDADHAAVAELVQLGERWVAETTGLPSASHLTAARAATPEDWAEHATHAFGELLDPIATKMVGAIRDQATAADPAGAGQALAQLGPMFMGISAGSILGELARDVTGVHDVGMPAADDTLLLILPAIDRTAHEYGLDVDQARLWVALRAAAHRLTFEGFPRTHFFALYHNYIASLDFDFSESLRRLQELDLSDPSRLQDVFADDTMFSRQTTPETDRAAERIAALLSVVDAYTDTAARTAGVRAGDLTKIREAFTRRAAEPASGRSLLTNFMGLEPDTRIAASFVGTIFAAGGWPLLNILWDRPDGFPSAGELTDPDTWMERVRS